jgi:acyl-CoA thioester hydrolase
MRLSEFSWSNSFRVRWSETDAQGVVFNARYLDYADIAITEYWRAAGLRLGHPEEALEFHVARATVNYRKPIKPEEMLSVTARTTKFGRTSMTYQVAIFGNGGDDDLRADVELVYVHVDLATHQSTPFPNWLPEKFAAFDARA